MNPLKEHAHLFANGKFKAIDHQWGAGVDDTPDPDLILGCNISHDALILDDDSDVGYFSDPHYCTLIARPIEDMRDEEIIGWAEAHKGKWNATIVSAELNSNGMMYLADKNGQRSRISTNTADITAREMIHLLSIGVYPFDQSHFDDGTVIDSTTV